MAFGKPDSPPPVPNANQVSGAQTGSNIKTGIANSWMSNPNVSGPQGSWTNTVNRYINVGGNKVPQFNQKFKYSPGEQAIYNRDVKNRQGMGNVAGQQITKIGAHLGQPINADGLPEMTESVDTDWSQDRQRVEDASMSRLNPQLERDNEALRTRLANQGIMPGSQAYQTEMQDMTNASTDARMQAILAGGQEQSRLFDIDKQAGAFGNAARQQAFSERMGLRNQPINEITALMSGGQVASPGQPNWASSMVQPTNVAGNSWDAYGAQMNNYNMQQQQQNAMMGGLFGLGGSAITGGLFG